MHAEQRSAAVGEEEALKDRKKVSRLQGLFEGGSMLLVASVFGNGMNYFFMLFLARQLGTDDFGLYALGVTIFNTLLLVATTSRRATVDWKLGIPIDRMRAGRNEPRPWRW